MDRPSRRTRTKSPTATVDVVDISKNPTDPASLIPELYFNVKPGATFEDWLKDYSLTKYGDASYLKHCYEQGDLQEFQILKTYFDRISLLRGDIQPGSLAASHIPRPGVVEAITVAEAEVFRHLEGLHNPAAAVARIRELYHERAIPAGRVEALEQVIEMAVSVEQQQNLEIRLLCMVEVMKEDEPIFVPFGFVNELNLDYILKAISHSDERVKKAEVGVIAAMQELIGYPIKTNIPVEEITMSTQGNKPEQEKKDRTTTEQSTQAEPEKEQASAEPVQDEKVPFMQTRAATVLKGLAVMTVGGLLGYGINRKTGWL